MTILFILEYYHPHTGGVETFFKNLVEALNHRGNKVIIVTNRYDATLPKKEISENIEIRRYRFFNRYLFTFGAWIVALPAAMKADLIHTTSYNAALPSWIVAKLLRKKSLITFHEVWGDLWKELPWMTDFSKKLHRFLEDMICKLRFDRFVAVSDYTKTSLINAGIPSDQVVRIYNGIEYPAPVHHQSTSSPAPFDFFFFGRVSFSKGVDVLLAAIHSLKQIRSDFHLTMVIPSEETPLLAKVKRLMKELEIQDLITVKHDLPFDRLQSEIAASDAVVIPSYSEGFCFAAVETMAIGTPIISSGRGALQEVVTGKHLTLPHLDTESLTAAMNDAIEGRWMTNPLVEFPLEDTINQYLSLYEKLIGRS